MFPAEVTKSPSKNKFNFMAVKIKNSDHLLEEEIILKEIGKISCELLHDLISPINGLTLYLETFGNKDLQNLIIPVNKTSSDIRNFIEIIREAMRNPNKIEVVNVQKVIFNVVSLFRHKAISKEIQMRIAQNTRNVLVVGNKLKVYQMMINLITNSIEAFEEVKNREKQIITISISNERGLSLIVADNAHGIPKEDLKKIFAKNFTTKEKGFGLGLANTKEIVEKDLGGTITVKSVPWQGSKFKISIGQKHLINYQ